MGSIQSSRGIPKSGRELVQFQFSIDGHETPVFHVSVDDLCVYGWYVESKIDCWIELNSILDEQVALDLIIERLPNEQGGDRDYKAVLLRELCRRVSNGLATSSVFRRNRMRCNDNYPLIILPAYGVNY